MADGGVAKLKYFDLSGFNGIAGRGGAVRFFMLTSGIKFEEEFVDFSTWASQGRQAAIDSGESPTGYLPVLRLDGHNLIEHVSICRLLAKRVGTYGKDDRTDYLADALAEAASTGFRVAKLKAAFGSAEDKQAWTSSPDQRAHYYRITETLLQNSGATGKHSVGNSPSFADAVLFSVLWDDVALFGEDKTLVEASPKLQSFYQAYMQQEEVAQWCRRFRPDLCP